MKNILVIFGTRPEAIKMAPLVLKLKENTLLNTKLCVTAQHREMLDQVLHFFKLTADYDLDLMQKNQSLNKLASRILDAVDDVLLDFNPDVVLVHGDTTTSSMAALAAFHRNIKVAHVEAGLRTYNKHAPFPEEINRQLTARLADYHFAPTIGAIENLIKNEGVRSENVYNTGNTVIDALLLGLQNINQQKDQIVKLKKYLVPNKRTILVTGHRRENFGDNFISLCKALNTLANREDVQIVFPVHLNPKIKDIAYDHLKANENIYLSEPLDYEAFIWIMNECHFIITDSGGIQEEAPTLKKPVLVTRDLTERMEAVDLRVVKLTGSAYDSIVKNSVALLENKEFYNQMVSSFNPYGDGKTSEKIINILMKE